MTRLFDLRGLGPCGHAAAAAAVVVVVVAVVVVVVVVQVAYWRLTKYMYGNVYSSLDLVLLEQNRKIYCVKSFEQ